MKTVKVTLKLEFETEDADHEILRESIASQLEEMIENDELMDRCSIKITEQASEDDEEDPSINFDDEEDL